MLFNPSLLAFFVDDVGGYFLPRLYLPVAECGSTEGSLCCTHYDK